MRRNYAFHPLIKVRGICSISSSSSKPQNTTATTTNTQETNLYDTGSGNVDVANSSGNVIDITNTCEGSIADAAALGQSAIQANSQVALSSENVADEALDALTQAQVGSASLVEQTTSSEDAIEQQALTETANATSSQVASQTTIKYVLLAVGAIAVIAIAAYAYTHKGR